jgi:peroxiredoxin
MKRLAIVIFMLSALSCRGPETETDPRTTYTLTGRIGGLDEGQAYIRHRQAQELKIDTAYIHDGIFIFKGRADTPEFCNLGFLINGQMDFRLGFFLENGKLSLAGRIDSLDDASIRITGSPTEDEFRAVSRRLIEFRAGFEDLDKQYKLATNSNNEKLKDSVEKAVKALNILQKTMIKEFARQHPSSFVAAFEIRSEFGFDPDDARELDSLYTRLAPDVRGSYYGREVKEILEKARLTDIGQPAPDFTLEDPKGKPVALSSFRGKYLLVDFWASWCGPCRRENPAVVKAYKHWHPKGFNILGVSLDDNRAKWLEAVEKDSLTWTQVSDLKGWQNAAARLYGIRGIPINFLVDGQGKIVAKNLRGDALGQKLASLY